MGQPISSDLQFLIFIIMSTTSGQNLSLGKLRRAVSSSASDYTTEFGLSNAAGVSSAGSNVKMSEFSIDTVDNSLSGFQFVDEQTSEVYGMTFTNSGSRFQDKIGSLNDNFTWTTNNSTLFNMGGTTTQEATYTAGAIEDARTTYDDNLITNKDFITGSIEDSYFTSSGIGIHTYSDGDPGADLAGSGSARCVKFTANGAFITQSFTTTAYSTYKVEVRTYNDTSANDLTLVVSASDSNKLVRLDAASQDEKDGSLYVIDNFHVSGSTTVQVKLERTGSASGDIFADHFIFRRWAGPQFNNQSVQISGKFAEDGQSDGFNDHATRYNTAVTKNITVLDTYGGQSVACFLVGTEVSKSDGTVSNIEDLDVNDTILGATLPGLPDEDLGEEWKEHSSAEGTSFSSANVTIKDIWYDYVTHYWNINNRVKVSGQHYMWTLRDGWWQWIIADQLKVGDSLLNRDLSVEEITSKDFNGYGEYEVVNINVETEDVYFAADVLSHNKGTNSI